MAKLALKSIFRSPETNQIPNPRPLPPTTPNRLTNQKSPTYEANNLAPKQDVRHKQPQYQLATTSKHRTTTPVLLCYLSMLYKELRYHRLLNMHTHTTIPLHFLCTPEKGPDGQKRKAKTNKILRQLTLPGPPVYSRLLDLSLTTTP